MGVCHSPPSLPQLVKQEQLSLDGLFALPSHDLERVGLSREEEGKLKAYLSLLSSCYSEPHTHTHKHTPWSLVP